MITDNGPMYKAEIYPGRNRYYSTKIDSYARLKENGEYESTVKD